MESDINRNKRKKYTEERKMKTAIRNELDMNQMEQVAGGTVNKNPTPNNPQIDSIINGDNYDAIAQAIANWLNGDNVRSRNVQNDVDIYDCDI